MYKLKFGILFVIILVSNMSFMWSNDIAINSFGFIYINSDDVINSLNIQSDSWKENLNSEAKMKESLMNKNLLGEIQDLSNDNQIKDQEPKDGTKKIPKERQKGIDDYEEKIKSIEEEIRRLETIVTKEIKSKNKEIKKLEKLNDELEKNRDEKEIEKTEYIVYTKQLIINEFAQQLSDYYGKLAELQKGLATCGDPVDIVSGRFIAEYRDFEAEDYLEKFLVTRKLNYENCKESFGNNWNCSLDSRIVRCKYIGIEEQLETNNKILSKIRSIKQYCNEFISKYGSVSHEINSYYSEALELEVFYENKNKELNELMKINNFIDSKNCYVTYGQFCDENEITGSEELLIFLSEFGQKFYFKYMSNGKWKLVNELLEDSVVIRGLDENGEYSHIACNSGGYELIFDNGSKEIFSKYGILQKKIDKNLNETIYKNDKGRINEIKLKTGEMLEIKRNQNDYITSISGPVSGTTTYQYIGDNLSKVIDNNNILLEHDYNNLGELNCITKGDGTKILIEYEFSPILNHNICVSVINENGKKEEFFLDSNKRTMKHKDYGSGFNYYKFDENGNTIYFSDTKQNIMHVEYKENGLISSITENGVKRKILYDELNRPCSIVFDNGSEDNLHYNNLGYITEVKDRDGFFNSYEYDNYGNVIKTKFNNNICGVYEYYENGLLKTLLEDGVKIEYKYNNFGCATEKIKKLPNGEKNIYKWVYDDKNRLTEYITPDNVSTKYFYEDNKEIIIKNDIKVIKVFDNRGRLVEESSEQISAGIKYKKRNVYDGVGNITEVYINNKLLGEYEYYDNRLLKSFIIWNNPTDLDLFLGIKTEIKYNNKWDKIAEIRSVIDKNGERERKTVFEYEYETNGNNKRIIDKSYLNKPVIYTYDKNGRLIKKEYESDYYEEYKYLKSGRLFSKKNSNNEIFKYVYKDTGGYDIIYTNQYGTKITYSYNKYNKIESITDCYGYAILYDYDKLGQLITQRNPFYKIKQSYDKSGRVICYCVENNDNNIVYEFSIIYDDEKREQKILSDNKIISIEKYDVWDRLIESNSIQGHYYYEYDFLGNCKKITDFYGNYTEIEYTPYGEVLLEKSSNGTERSYSYNLLGNPIEVSQNNKIISSYEYGKEFIKTNNLGNSNYLKIDSNNKLINISNYDTGNIFVNKQNNNEITVTDDYGNKYVYKIGINGNKISEVNPMGYIANYEYDLLGRLVKKRNYSGKTQTFKYDKKANKKIINYDNGKTTEIIRNQLGYITDIITDDYSLDYNYDKSGNVISQYSSKTDSFIKYEYDNFSRCIKKSGNSFCFMYFYDEMSRLIKVIDEKSGNWIYFEYDGLSRIKKQKFSNGMVINCGYTETGKKEYSVVKNQLGQIITAEYVLYNEDDKIKMISDKNGNITKFEYDDRGRLISTEYPYTKKLEDFYVKEAVDCGFFNKNLDVTFSKIKLTSNDIIKINDIYEKAEVKVFTSINKNQNCWKEEYTYNKNGNLISLHNPLGDINYEYDCLNRLISKNYGLTNEHGIKLKWNKDNCLEEIFNNKEKITFIYGEYNRPIRIEKINYISGEKEIIEFIYDGLGRRVFEKNANNNIEYIYDGLSNQLISKQYVTNNDFISTPVYDFFDAQNDNLRIIDYKEYNESSDYKLLQTDEYTPYAEYKIKLINEKKENPSSQNIIDKNKAFNILSFGKKQFMICYADGSTDDNTNVGFILTDLKNNMRGIVKTNSNKISYSDFDTWGNAIDNNLIISYQGKHQIDFDYNNIYDFGYRDYIPSLKCFTTEDPAQDGKNWYAYCPCDPINFYDNSGFSKKGYTESENSLMCSELVLFLQFDKEEYEKAIVQYQKYLGMDVSFDCADVSTFLNYYAAVKGGLDPISDLTEDFGNYYEKDDIKGAKESTCSKVISEGKKTRKVCDGVDSELLDRDPNNKKELKRRDKLLENLSDPNIITPGTIFVWQNSEYNSSEAPEHCGHTATVLSREFDDEGNVVGFILMEGHTGGNKTEIKYMSVEDWKGEPSVENYWGQFCGVYEIENSDVEEAKDECLK